MHIEEEFPKRESVTELSDLFNPGASACAQHYTSVPWCRCRGMDTLGCLSRFSFSLRYSSGECQFLPGVFLPPLGHAQARARNVPKLGKVLGHPSHSTALPGQIPVAELGSCLLTAALGSRKGAKGLAQDNPVSPEGTGRDGSGREQ